MKSKLIYFFILIIYSYLFAQTKLGTLRYEDFKKPEFCGSSCHTEFYQQWKQAMMSQAYTHEWDEIEYFKLAVPHAEKDQKVSEVKAGCNGCHSPIAYVAGDVPPPLPSKNSRANESVSCDVCHSITGFAGDTPYNFNYIMKPGNTKYSSRMPDIKSPAHEIEINPIMKTGDFCGICHNEKSPYDVWVKSTHLEWKEGPYAKEGVQCQTCHMPKAPGKLADMGEYYPDVAQHLFHGAHDPGKLRGTVELRIHPDTREVEPGEQVKFTVILYNTKAGHKIPTGSAEERMLWLHVEAKDSRGNTFHLKVDKKGFPGEEYTIADSSLAYQDMGIPLNIPNFQGVLRDGVPVGDRIFRLPYFDPQGRMTIMQWNTASQGVDYRIGPREAKVETFTWTVPDNLQPGELVVTAVLNYQRLPTAVAKFLGVPDDEIETIIINSHQTKISIVD